MDLKKITKNLNIYKKTLTSGIDKYLFGKAVNPIFFISFMFIPFVIVFINECIINILKFKNLLFFAIF